MGGPEPGWYRDPDAEGLRYWDGGAWTEHRQAAAPPAPARREIPGLFWLLLAACAAVVVGSLGPWATNAFASVNGLSGDGWITLILAGLGLASLYKAYNAEPVRLQSWAPVIIGIIVAALGLYDAAQVEDAGSTRFGQVATVGWGLYLVIAGGIAMAIAGWRYTRMR
jgi:hypothetical protein